MAYDFPASPAENQEFTPPGGPGYVYKTPRWIAKGTAAATYIGDAAPASPAVGQLWWDSDSGRLYIYYNDGNTSQWVEAVAAPVDLTNFVTKTAGNFTGNVTATGSITAGAGFISTDATFRAPPGTGYVYILSGTQTGGGVVLRPTADGTNQAILSDTGVFTAPVIQSYGAVTANTYFTSSSSAVIVTPTSTPGDIYIRPLGWNNQLGEFRVNNLGEINVRSYAATAAIVQWMLESNGTTRSNWVTATNAANGYCYWRVFNNAGAYDGALSMTGNATAAGRILDFNGNTANKALAGSWTATSDARIKEVHGDYTLGLAEILQLQPKRFHYLGNDHNEDPAVLRSGDTETPRSVHENMEDTEIVGMIAQEIKPIMPDTVTLAKGWIDGKEVDDMHKFDPTNLAYALINAVKEMKAIIDEQAARIAALEAANGGV